MWRPLLASLVLGVGLVGCAPEDEPLLDDEETRGAIEALGLGPDHRCGDEMTKYRAADGAVETPVFKGKDRPWHDWRPCLEDLRGVAGPGAPKLVYDTLYNQILYLLSHERIKFYKAGKTGRKRLSKLVDGGGKLKKDDFDRLVETNDHGLAYSTMDQVDLGITLLRWHKTLLGGPQADDHRTRAYLALGLGALGVVVDEVGDGGLRSKKTCEKDKDLTCAWFHAQTSTSSRDTKVGGTLNKHLYGVRDLYQSGNVLREIDLLKPDAALIDRADRHQKIALQGMNQMVYSAEAKEKGDLPTLMDYIPRHDGKPIAKSWLYYGRNIVKGSPYFLKENTYKNCGYHVLVIKLLQKNLEYMIAEGADISGFTKDRADLGTSVIEFIIDAWELKKPDLYTDSNTKSEGNFLACDEEHTAADEPDAAIAWLQELL